MSLIDQWPIWNPFENALHRPLVWCSENHIAAAAFEPTPRRQGLFSSHWDWNLQPWISRKPLKGFEPSTPPNVRQERPATALKTNDEVYCLNLYRDLYLVSGGINCNLVFLQDPSCAPLCHDQMRNCLTVNIVASLIYFYGLGLLIRISLYLLARGMRGGGGGINKNYEILKMEK